MTNTETMAWLATVRDNARTVNDGEGEPLALKCEEAIECVRRLLQYFEGTEAALAAAPPPDPAVLAWARERLANTQRIAATKTGADRAGWLEDGAYWAEIVAVLAAAPPSDCDPPDEALYRSYSRWQLEQLRREFAAERDTGRTVTGDPRRMPVPYYDARVTLIDRLLAAAPPPDLLPLSRDEVDTVCGWLEILTSRVPAFAVEADDAALHRKLGAFLDAAAPPPPDPKAQS